MTQTLIIILANAVCTIAAALYIKRLLPAIDSDNLTNNMQENNAVDKSIGIDSALNNGVDNDKSDVNGFNTHNNNISWFKKLWLNTQDKPIECDGVYSMVDATKEAERQERIEEAWGVGQ